MTADLKYSLLLPIIISFVVSVVLFKFFIPWLHKLNFGQYIREEGPKAHQKKSGTPTMGGIIIIVAICVSCLIFGWAYPSILPVLLMTLAFGLVGFLDDYIKVVKKRNLGLTAIQKLAAQIVITAIFAVYIIKFSDAGTAMLVPFTGGFEDGLYIELPMWLYLISFFIIVLGTVNGTNLTDGLDGLLGSVTVSVAAFFMIAAAMAGSGLHPIAAAVVGALMGYLIYNFYPARVFMGDTGSLALGGFVASIAYMLNMPIFIAIVGLIYLIEILSDILQVTYFKVTHGKRILKMAPLHHHLELSGWPETKVVILFAVCTAVLCVVGLLAL